MIHQQDSLPTEVTRRRLLQGLLVLLGGVFVAALVIGRVSFSSYAADEPFQLGLPIDCRLGEDCYILQYPDRDPGPEASEFGCGRMTYDGHKGTDFGIANERVMAEGVPVIASAAGRVLRVRDGVIDRRIRTNEDRVAIEGIECGNGLVVDSGDGWEVQYCHLREGSVVVRSGMEVEKGDRLGLVGQSGLASFPHVHITVRHEGEVVDPFDGAVAGAADLETCGSTAESLWEEPLAYEPTGLIRAGFATEPPTLEQIWRGELSEERLPAASNALLFWVHVYGVLAGDEEQLQLIPPNGQAVGKEDDSLPDQRIWLSFAGRRDPGGQPGDRWRGHYTLTRDGQVLIDIERELELR